MSSPSVQVVHCDNSDAQYLRFTIINGYKYYQFWKIADLVGINFSDFDVIYSNVAMNLILASSYNL